MPVLNAFKFHMLESFAAQAASSLNYYEKRHKKIDRMMGDIDYDLGPDGEQT